MIRVIRADIYKLLRGKALYVTLSVLLFGIYITVSDYTGIDSISRLLLDTEVLLFFLIAVVTITIMPMFTFGTVKSTLAWGMLRSKLYFSKLILCMILCILIVVLYVGIGLILSTLLNGWGGIIPENFWINMLKTISAQLLFLLAYTSIGVLVAFTVKKSIVLISILFSLAFMHVFVRIIVETTNVNAESLMRFEITRNIRTLSQVIMFEPADVRTFIGIGIVYIVASTVAGIVLFNKAEIK
jgi:ABC-type transport system involved in multi-copper enzyme maturation permease subunit